VGGDSRADVTFKSKVDAWLVVVIGAALLAAPVILLLNPNAPRHPPMGDGVAIMIGLAVVVLPGALIAWIFRTTEYTVTETDLLVRSGPISEKIPLASIKKISATRSILSAPALSLDRLKVQYGKFGAVVISPDDKQAFAQAILARAPGVVVEGVAL
jgi:hypothetical protein